MDFIEFVNNFTADNNLVDHELTSIIILSPYPSKSFFKDVFLNLNPQRVDLITDVATSDEVIDDIENLVQDSEIILNIRFSECTGITHAKAYLLTWKTVTSDDVTVYRRLLLWGSCNASDGGFGRNAEIYSWCDLNCLLASERKKIRDYFIALKTKKKKNIQPVIAQGGKRFTIHLPEILIINPSKVGFDSWLQKGYLCHQLLVEPDFGAIRVKLKEKPGTDDPDTEFLRKRLNLKIQKSFSYKYHDVDFEEPDKEERWKGKYFVDTNYGLWTSPDCFRRKHDGFVKSGYKDREKVFNKVNILTDGDADDLAEGFCDYIVYLTKEMKNPMHFFEYKRKTLNIDYYLKQAKIKIDEDRKYSQQPYFKNSYIYGYDFVELPSVRNNNIAWQKFTSSFGESIRYALKMGKKNRLAETIRGIDENSLLRMNNGQQVCSWFRKNWEEFGSTIRSFDD